MSRVRVKPGEGRTVYLPSGRRVPDDGCGVRQDDFINRRLACGDLVLIDALPDAPAAETPAPVADKPKKEG